MAAGGARYRCQRCHEGEKVLGAKELTTESWCRLCSSDTKWIRDEIQDPAEEVYLDPNDDGEEFTEASKVQLSVGGTVFHTSVATLLQQDPHSFFSGAFSNQFRVEVEGGGRVIRIDRSPKWFPHVLDFCRQGCLPDSAHLTCTDLHELLEEADFYSMSRLAAYVTQLLERARSQQLSLCEGRLQDLIMVQDCALQQMREVANYLDTVPPSATHPLRQSLLQLVTVTNASLQQAQQLLPAAEDTSAA
eukprot:TRINITY_DN1971_c3_g1_i1.p1 TRINITY_DN1971_c3_g1~~TRINITY_DN1971_c3_g1_i1.p1  ORF type:complete len:260 (+),score=111.51 TRINITY_DN1971_c3_g1_i1:41-781(+)